MHYIRTKKAVRVAIAKISLNILQRKENRPESSHSGKACILFICILKAIRQIYTVFIFRPHLFWLHSLVFFQFHIFLLAIKNFTNNNCPIQSLCHFFTFIVFITLKLLLRVLSRPLHILLKKIFAYFFMFSL